MPNPIIANWVGNRHLFGFMKPFEQSLGGVGKLNDVLIAAPASKALLSIVPITQLMQGYPKVEDLDLNTSLSLFFTGAVFAVYSGLVYVDHNGQKVAYIDHVLASLKAKRPLDMFRVPSHLRGNVGLLSVNFVMAIVHGYNCGRRLIFDYKKSREPPQCEGDFCAL